MTLTPTSNKKENIRDIAAVLLLKQSCSIRTLKTSKGNFDITIKQLSSASPSEIKWWHNHIMHAKLSIKPTPDIDYVIYILMPPVNQVGELMMILIA